MSAIRVRDDRGRTLVWARPPQRVASLVPSDSYTLAHIGAGSRLVARTEFCVEPAAALGAVPTVGGTKNVDVDRLVALQPTWSLPTRRRTAAATSCACTRPA